MVSSHGAQPECAERRLQELGIGLKVMLEVEE
jgi:hypothetical protein